MKNFMMILGTFLMACGDDATTEQASETVQTEKQPEPAKTDAAPSEHAAHDGHGTPDGKMPNIGSIPEGAKVFFVEPADGATVKSPLLVKMGVEGMTVQPAGEIVDGTGHHHIIIDADAVATGMVVPADDQHKHFGKGQTETELLLPTGEHTLRLQFANGIHQSYGEQLSATIKVIVE